MYANIISVGAKVDSTRYFESDADHVANTPYLVTNTPSLQKTVNLQRISDGSIREFDLSSDAATWIETHPSCTIEAASQGVVEFGDVDYTAPTYSMRLTLNAETAVFGITAHLYTWLTGIQVGGGSDQGGGNNQSGGAVSSINGQTGDVNLTASDILFPSNNGYAPFANQDVNTVVNSLYNAMTMVGYFDNNGLYDLQGNSYGNINEMGNLLPLSNIYIVCTSKTNRSPFGNNGDGGWIPTSGYNKGDMLCNFSNVTSDETLGNWIYLPSNGNVNSVAGKQGDVQLNTDDIWYHPNSETLTDELATITNSLLTLSNQVSSIPNGPTGPAGPTGPQGPQGPTGPSGSGAASPFGAYIQKWGQDGNFNLFDNYYDPLTSVTNDSFLHYFFNAGGANNQLVCAQPCTILMIGNISAQTNIGGDRSTGITINFQVNGVNIATKSLSEWASSSSNNTNELGSEQTVIAIQKFLIGDVLTLIGSVTGQGVLTIWNSFQAIVLPIPALPIVSYSPIKIVSQPTNGTAQVGDAFSFSFSVAVPTGVTLAGVQWYKDSTPISGATSLTYTINSVTNADYTNYYATATDSNSNTVTTDTVSLSAGSLGGGGGNGDLPCPAPYVMIDTPNGPVAAGELYVGMLVYAMSEITLAYGTYPVQAVKRAHNDLWTLEMEDGRTFDFAPNHRFFTPASYVELQHLKPGDQILGTNPGIVKSTSFKEANAEVVQITVMDAHTYLTSGLVSHNIKIQ